LSLSVVPFLPEHAVSVRDLFVRVNRLLAPAAMKEQFEAYIERSLAEEIDRIDDYYRARNGGFWVAIDGNDVVGMFGLEQIAPDAMELRRMYVDPDQRRRGIARKMLASAEAECGRRGFGRLDLSTSELQGEALALYRNAGYRIERDEVAIESSNKTLGGGIKRYYFTKEL
jgi:GNAT superfamily N-acetyltransferase